MPEENTCDIHTLSGVLDRRNQSEMFESGNADKLLPAHLHKSRTGIPAGDVTMQQRMRNFFFFLCGWGGKDTNKRIEEVSSIQCAYN